MFRQTPIANETPREFPVCFPPGTIFRAVGTTDATARFTILVKNDGTTRTLRCNDKTWKDSAMLKEYDGLTAEAFAKNLAEWKNWTITADVKTPVGWFVASWPARQAHYAIPLNTPAREASSLVLGRIIKQQNQDWRAYLEQLQALYPFLKTIEKAPYSANVPLRMTNAGPQPVPTPEPVLQVPELLMPTSVATTSVATTSVVPPPKETITLTRDQMNYIYTMASGRALTDEVWAVVKQVASR